MNKLLIVLSLVGLLFCTKNQPKQVNYKSSLNFDWSGTYSGLTPCADCGGIETSLTIDSSGVFSLFTHYLGEDDGGQTISGNFTWNKAGNSIKLSSEELKDRPIQFLVEDGHIYQLDMQGNRVTGELADFYKLVRESESILQIAGTWELYELQGKPISGLEKNLSITFSKFGNRVNGFSGCNTFFGNFEIENDYWLRFSQLASTQMACHNMKLENRFMSVLNQIDNFSIHNDILSINKARMAPLARFRLVK